MKNRLYIELYLIFSLITFVQAKTNETELPLKNISNNPEAVKLVELGKIKWDKEDYKGSLEDCKKALILDPQYSSALFCCSTARQVLGDKEGAFRDATRLFQSGPDFLKPELKRISLNTQSIGYSKSIRDLNALEEITTIMFKFYLAGMKEVAQKANAPDQIILIGLKVNSLTKLRAEINEVKAKVYLNNKENQKALEELKKAKNLYLALKVKDDEHLKELDERISSLEEN